MRTRAAEFCYIAERGDANQRDGHIIMAMMPMDDGMPVLMTKDPEQALRFTRDGIIALQRRMGSAVGARKVLAAFDDGHDDTDDLVCGRPAGPTPTAHVS